MGQTNRFKVISILWSPQWFTIGDFKAYLKFCDKFELKERKKIKKIKCKAHPFAVFLFLFLFLSFFRFYVYNLCNQSGIEDIIDRILLEPKNLSQLLPGVVKAILPQHTQDQV